MTRRTSRTDSVQSPQTSPKHAYSAHRTLGVYVHYTARDKVSAELFERELTREMLKLTRQAARQKRHHVKVHDAVIARDHA